MSALTVLDLLYLVGLCGTFGMALLYRGLWLSTERALESERRKGGHR